MKEISISDIPAEGLHLQGRLPSSIFDLSPEDSIQPKGDVVYDLMAYRFDDDIVFEGHLSGPFQLQCNTCMEYFDYPADFPEWQSDLELEKGQRTFDLEQLIREDFLLELPSHPHCDEDGDRDVCPKEHLLGAGEEAGEKPSSGNTVWDTLDKLN